MNQAPPKLPRSLPMLDAVGGDESSLDRRGFLAQSVMLAAAAALAGSCAPQPFGLSLKDPVTVTVSDYPALADAGGVAVIRSANVPIAVANLGDGSFVALSLICPHMGGNIGWYESESVFVCSLHGATFADDGSWVGGQPTRNMYQYQTSYDATAGTITVSR